jgi:hypothetical protein
MQSVSYCMSYSVESLLDAINEGWIFDQLNLPAGFGVESLLNAREADDFEAKMLESIQSMESNELATRPDAAQKEVSTTIRKAAYLKAFERWKSPELAACISDDIGLIADAIAANSNDPWIEGLLKCYLNGVIPCGVN